MARFDRGWFKMFRGVAFGEIGERSNDCLGLWLRLLCMATTHETEITWGRTLRKIPAGAVVTSLPELTGSQDSSGIALTRRNLEFLEIRQSIRQESSKRGRIIFIINWDRYQSVFKDAAVIQQIDRQTTGSDAADTRHLIEERRKKERENTGPTLSEQIEKSVKIWQGTLTHFGADRSLTQRETEQIARAIQKHGAEAVDLALFGARFEAKTERFDPRSHVSLSRVLEKDKTGMEKFDKFINLGAQARGQASKREVVEVEISC